VDDEFYVIKGDEIPTTAKFVVSVKKDDLETVAFTEIDNITLATKHLNSCK